MVALDNAVAVVTGGGSGIGRALAERLVAAGARAVVVADLDAAAVREAAAALGAAGHGYPLDVTDEAAVHSAVAGITAGLGDIDIWCSNAGVSTGEGLGDDSDWDRAWRVHVLAHVYAARAVLPRMAARGHGEFMVTASAAGLLTEMDTAPYPVTKHGAVALAEWLAIRYADSGVGISCLCPQAVRTPMTAGLPAGSATLASGAMLETSDVVDAVFAAWARRSFLILPHPEVAEYERRRVADRDRWLAGMRRIRAGLGARREP